MTLIKNIIDKQVYIIAEIGGNHNGDFGKAKEMVYAAGEAGAAAVKFQVFIPEKLCHPSQKPLPILKGKYKSQQDRFRDLVFSESQYYELKQLTDKIGIDFVATPFDLQSADMLENLVRFYKIASGDNNNIHLIKYLINKDKPVIVSTGMASLEEIDQIYNIVDHNKLAFLHCVSLYPTPTDKANLLMISYLKERYPEITIGFSDHHPDIRACLYSVVLGARIVEKHFTFDKSISYGDHSLSADYEDLKNMVQEIRDITDMIGEKGFKQSDQEMENRIFFRRGIYTSREIQPGETLKESDLILLRPPTDIVADEIINIIGRTVKRNLQKEEAVSWGDLV